MAGFSATRLSKAMDSARKLMPGAMAPLDSPAVEAVVKNASRTERTDRIRQLDAERTADIAEGNADHEAEAENLAKFVERKTRDAINAKCQNKTQDELMEAFRFYCGEYTGEELQNMPAGESNALWFPLVEMMTRRMHAFLRSTLSGKYEHPRFDMRPTTEPEVPQALLDAATESVIEMVLLKLETGVEVTPTQLKAVAESMGERLFEEALESSRYSVRKCKRAVDDRLDHSNYQGEYDKVLYDVVLYGTGLLFGPYPVLERSAAFDDESNLDWGLRKKMQWRALDPLYFFPSVDSTDGQDGEYWTYIDYMTGSSLYVAQSCDGWIGENIEQILIEHKNGYSGLRNGTLGDTKQMKRQTPTSSDNRFEIIWYHGSVRGNFLLENNWKKIDGRDIVAHGFYDMEIYVCAGLPICIRCPLDPKQERPLHKAVLFDKPGTFWGRGVYNELRDNNRLANSALTAMPVDMAYAAQAMFEWDKSLVDDEEVTPDAFPGMIVEKDSSANGLSGNVLTVHNLPSNVSTFMQIIRECVEHSEQILGLPRYLTGGAQGSGALRTASGLAQLQSNAHVGLEAIIVNIDHGITKPAIGMLHRFVVETSNDPDIVGDVEIVVLGATAMLARQTNRDQIAQQLQLFMPFIQMGWIPVDAALDLLREVAGAVGQDGRKLVPDRMYEEAKQRELAAALATIGLSIDGQPVAQAQAAGGAVGGSALPGAGGVPDPQALALLSQSGAAQQAAPPTAIAA